jgi:hypothetical protein
VVYLPRGHEAHLEASNDKASARPWLELRQRAAAAGGALREAEPCRVMAIGYKIGEGGGRPL